MQIISCVTTEMGKDHTGGKVTDCLVKETYFRIFWEDGEAKKNSQGRITLRYE